MIAAGALPLTATILLAGCGGKSSEVTAASTPAAPESVASEPAAAESPASESAASEVPASVVDGLVQPAGVSDVHWAEIKEQFGSLDDTFKDVPTKDLSEFCGMDIETVIANMGWNSLSGDLPARIGGSAEEWSAVMDQYANNAQHLACEMSK